MAERLTSTLLSFSPSSTAGRDDLSPMHLQDLLRHSDLNEHHFTLTHGNRRSNYVNDIPILREYIETKYRSISELRTSCDKTRRDPSRNCGTLRRFGV
ncbi:hypothetical protein GJ496_003028 [Pomphorhynchus laevis]|nr:hypothetical protein GJ496_003028 [Pomphorhynchus laevis]